MILFLPALFGLLAHKELQETLEPQGRVDRIADGHGDALEATELRAVHLGKFIGQWTA